jgi:pyridoxal 5'-phosphate synthase pdxT subunit
MKTKIGILALQGDFEAHSKVIDRLGAEPVEVRRAAELETIDGLILPGGESTTMLKLLHEEKLFEPLREFGQQKPIFGTCAGAILLAREVSHPKQDSLGLMNLAVERNGYGRQIDSRIAKIELDGHSMEAVFIRAPIIRSTSPETEVLASYLDQPVLVAEGRHMAATFHPELTGDGRVHQRFLEKVAAKRPVCKPGLKA